MDRIYVLDQGRIVQTGAYDALINSPGRFAELFAEEIGESWMRSGRQLTAETHP
jgi:ABC-type multidrug transport system fused ATPase/permease subunit